MVTGRQLALRIGKPGRQRDAVCAGRCHGEREAGHRYQPWCHLRYLVVPGFASEPLSGWKGSRCDQQASLCRYLDVGELRPSFQLAGQARFAPPGWNKLMLVFCNGMPRSGSTWSFNVTLGLLRRCLPGEEIQSGYSETPVEFLKAAVPTASHVVLKCHFLTPLARALVRTRAAKVVYTSRDLPDAIASWRGIFGRRFEEGLRAAGSSLELLAFHRSDGNAATISYAELLPR